MNWMRYQGSTLRTSRRDRERWVREKLQEAIALKQEQIRLGTRPKLTRTSIDPKESYFLRRLIHLDKATGGVTWKVFGDSTSTDSEVPSSPTRTPRRRPRSLASDRSSKTSPRPTKRRPLPALTDGTEYSHNTQSLARELQYTAAEEKQWVTRMTEVSDRAEEEEESLEGDSSDSGTSTDNSSSTEREKPRPRRARAVAKKPSTPRKSFSAKEIYAMLPTDSPNLNAATRCHRKRKPKTRRIRKRAASVQTRPIVEIPDESPREVRVPFKKARRESNGSSAQDSQSESSDTTDSVFVSETLTSSSRRTQTTPQVNHSASSSVSETGTCDSPSGTSTEISPTTFSPSPELAVRRTDASSNRRTPCSPAIDEGEAGSSRTSVEVLSPMSVEAACGSAASIAPRCVPSPVPPMNPPSIDITFPLLSEFDVSCRIEAKQNNSSTFNAANRAITSNEKSVAVTRGSFASTTSITTGKDQSGREQRVSSFQSSIRCDSRFEAWERMETDQKVIDPLAEVAFKRTREETRGAFVSRVSTSRKGKSGVLDARLAPAAVSTSSFEVSRRAEPHEKTASSAVVAVSSRQWSIKAQGARSEHSVTGGRRDPAPRSGKTDVVDTPVSVATTVLFNNRLNLGISASAERSTLTTVSNTSMVSRKSGSTLFSGSGYSLNSVRSIRKDSRKEKKKNSRKKQGVRTSPDLSYLPGLFLSPKIQTGSSNGDGAASYLDSSPSGNGTQTFASSLAEE